jgi:sulfite reductase (ferredoxin)
MSDEPDARSSVEAVKAASDHLRHPLVGEFAAGGSHISEEAYQLLKFHGSYQQDDRDQRNDRRRAGEEFAYGFMIRLRIPGGDIHPQLWLALDDLAGAFGRDTLRLTTRQSIQLHFIPKTDLRTVIRTVNEHLASTLGACGDVNRNVMAAPAPFRRPEYEVVREAARLISDHLLPRTRAYAELWLDGQEVARIGPQGDGRQSSQDDGAPEEEPLYGQTYLPRKFKTAVTVAGDNSVDLFTHDLGFVPIFDEGQLAGWNVYVGGGLGRTHRKPETFPRLADPLGFVGPDELLRAAEGVLLVQRDQGDRLNRRQARLKYLVHREGIDWFRAQVEAAVGIRFGPACTIDWRRFDDLLGWHEQGDGRWFYGLRILNGRVSDGEGSLLRSALRAIAAELRVPYRVTPNQNLYLWDVAPAVRFEVDRLLAEHGVVHPERVRGLRRLAMACPALPTCGLAITDAERALPAVLDQLQALFNELGLAEATPTVRMTGCPNGCARPYVAEIGLVGDAVDRYQVWLGGDAAGTRLAVPVAERVHRDDLPELLRPVLERYRDERLEGEVLGDFATRAGITSLAYTARPRPVAQEVSA